MNKAITDGLILTPPPFAAGLDVWSAGDGTPGSDTYAGAGSGAFVPADQDFGGALELLKTSTIQSLRYMGETPILPGCYLRVRARVKAIAGALPSVRIAGFAADASGNRVTDATAFAPAVQLTTYGEVVTVEAIVGTGLRPGNDMVWGEPVSYGHLGLDLTGPNGAVVRVDDIEIEDATSVFLRDLISMVDVRDYGAVGDGVTDDGDAFRAADAAAEGRDILVPEGVYRIESNISMSNRIKWEGTLSMPTENRFIMIKQYELSSYIDAFGDAELGFKKAFQALLFFSDHESLDMGGRRILLTEPLDMQAAVPTRTTFATRRVIRNGQFHIENGPQWDDTVVTAQASYNPSQARLLSNVANIGAIPIGALVEGTGVGREVYVVSKNLSAGTVTISQPLYDAQGTQSFTFRRFKYMLDFSGFDQLSSFQLQNLELQCENDCSGIMLSHDGNGFQITDCFITKPKDRGITSVDKGCQGLLIDRCQFLSSEQSLRVQDRGSIAFNTNANDVKIRDCRCVLFKHFCVVAGTGTTVVGNHWFLGDSETDGVRVGGIIFTTPNVKSLITGNYVDNNFIEWTNEHSADPNLGNQFSFGGLTVTGNTFTVNNSAEWFNFLVIKPYGSGHYIQGLNVSGNVFRSLNGFIDRVEHVDTTFADLDYGRMVNVVFEGNTFNGVREPIYNPVTKEHNQTSNSAAWIVDFDAKLPFGGRARTVEAVTKTGRVQTTSGATVYDAPWCQDNVGADRNQVRLNWASDCRGKVTVTARMDNPG